MYLNKILRIAMFLLTLVYTEVFAQCPPNQYPTPITATTYKANTYNNTSGKTTPPPQEKFSNEDYINSLILVDESTHPVLDLLEQLTQKTILRQQDLPKVKINLNSNGKITKQEAILALESLLSMNGIAIVEMGDAFLKAVPAAGVQTQSPTILTESSLAKRPSQVIYSKIYKLKYLTTQEGVAAIAGIATKGISAQVPLAKSNAILVVDTLTNLQRIERLFTEIDKPLALQEELAFYPLKYVEATDVKTQLEGMKKGNLKKYFETSTFEADKNSNQLIVVTHPQNKHIIDEFIKKLDVDVQPLNKSQVIRLKHAESVEVATLLKAVIKGIPVPKKESGDTRAQLIEKLRETVKPSTPGTTTEKGQQFSESLTLEADERSNAIVVYGTPRDIELVRNLIEEIDILLAQVQIEVIIAEVRLTDDQVSGLQTMGLAYNVKPLDPLAPQGKFQVRDALTPTTELLKTATKLNFSLNNFAFSDVFNIAQENDDVRILSAPMIVTTHNRKAYVKVVTDQPFISQSITSTTNTDNLNQTTDYIHDIGIVLEVTPRIAPNGIIQMEIKQTVKTLLPAIALSLSNKSSIEANPIVNREAESFVSVRDQEVIVLAGLQQRTNTKIRSKLWLLGCLPILGDLLFSPSQDTEIRTELVMFIRPHLMSNMEDVREVTCEAMDYNIVSNKAVDFFVEHGRFPQEGIPPWNCGLGNGDMLVSTSACIPEEKIVEEVEDESKKRKLKKRKHPCYPEGWAAD